MVNQYQRTDEPTGGPRFPRARHSLSRVHSGAALLFTRSHIWFSTASGDRFFFLFFRTTTRRRGRA